MALNTSKYNFLMPLHFKGLILEGWVCDECQCITFRQSFRT